MLVRRFAAIALAGALLHLNIVRADVACATHEHSSDVLQSEANHASAEHHMDGDATRGTQQSGHDEQACDTPSQQECCVALVSCSLSFGSKAAVAIGTSEPTHEGVIAALTAIPLSRVATPDPPPPKA